MRQTGKIQGKRGWDREEWEMAPLYTIIEFFLGFYMYIITWHAKKYVDFYALFFVWGSFIIKKNHETK